MSPFGLGIFYSVVTGVCWAFLAIGLKYALHFSSTGTIIWVRMLVAFTLLFAWHVFRAPSSIKKIFIKPPIRILIGALLLSCNYYAYMHGLELTTANNAQIMIQLGPLALLFVGVFYFHEGIRPIQWAGITLAALGFIFFNWDQVLVTWEHRDIYILGNAWIIFAAVTWAIFATIQKIQILKGWTPQEVNLLVYGICLAALVPLAQFHELPGLDLWQWFVLFLLGLNTLIAYGAFAEAIQLIPASYVSLIISVNPLLTILLMGMIAEFGLTFVAPEPIMWRGYTGAFMVVAGVAAAVSLRAKTPASQKL